MSIIFDFAAVGAFSTKQPEVGTEEGIVAVVDFGADIINLAVDANALYGQLYG